MQHCNTKHSGLDAGASHGCSKEGDSEVVQSFYPGFWIILLGVENTSSVQSCKLFDLEVQKRDKVKEMLLLGPSCGEKDRKAGEKIYRN